MSAYRVAVGHGVAFLDTDVLPQQPDGGNIRVVERSYSVNGRVIDKGAYVALHWDFVESEAAYLALLTLFDLHTYTSRDVTVYIKNERLVWGLYNGKAILPEPGSDMRYQNYFPRDITIMVVDLFQE